MSLPITERDISLMIAIDDFGFLTTKQIRRLFFEKQHRSAVYRRLKILHKRRLLKFNCTAVNGLYIWRLTPKAANVIGSGHVLKSINHNTIYHDALATDIRIELEKLGLGSNWTSSNRLLRLSERRSYGDKENIPDWLLLFMGLVKATQLPLNWNST